MKVYDKLVRDRIPEIIEESGKKCEVEVVSNEIALEYLYKKLGEEIDELLSDKNVDEIADVMEVLLLLLKSMVIVMKRFLMLGIIKNLLEVDLRII